MVVIGRSPGFCGGARPGYELFSQRVERRGGFDALLVKNKSLLLPHAIWTTGIEVRERSAVENCREHAINSPGI